MVATARFLFIGGLFSLGCRAPGGDPCPTCVLSLTQQVFINNPCSVPQSGHACVQGPALSSEARGAIEENPKLGHCAQRASRAGQGVPVRAREGQ